MDTGLTPRLGTEAKRADDLRLLPNHVLLNLAQAALTAKGQHKFDQILVFDAGLQLAVESVAGGLEQREAVDFLDGAEQLLGREQGALDPVRVAAETRIGAVTGAGRLAELAADLLLFLGGDLGSTLDEGMVFRVPRQGGRVRRAGGGVEERSVGVCALVE
jgi:hypothetical protein